MAGVEKGVGSGAGTRPGPGPGPRPGPGPGPGSIWPSTFVNWINKVFIKKNLKTHFL